MCSRLLIYYACMLCRFSPVWLCCPMDYSVSGFSVHGILQARILEWVAMPSSRGSSWPRDWTHISYVYLHRQAGSCIFMDTYMVMKLYDLLRFLGHMRIGPIFLFYSWKTDLEILRNLLIVFHQDSNRTEDSHSCLFTRPCLELFILFFKISTLQMWLKFTSVHQLHPCRVMA